CRESYNGGIWVSVNFGRYPVRGSLLKSERQPQSELNRPRSRAAGSLIGDQAGQRSGDASEVRAAHSGVGVGECRRVGEVRSLGAQFHLEPFTNREDAEQRQVQVA